MNEILSIINFSLLTILILLYICSFIFEIIFMINYENKHLIIFIAFILDSSNSFIMIIITIILGFISIYSSSKDKLFVYIIISFIEFFITIIFLIILVNVIKDIDKSKVLIIIILIIYNIKILILFFNIISSIYERQKIIKEIEESPLNYVDETITEDMYNSILSQCLNPDDKKLKKEFKKKLKKRKNKNTKIPLSSSTGLNTNQTV